MSNGVDSERKVPANGPEERTISTTQHPVITCLRKGFTGFKSFYIVVKDEVDLLGYFKVTERVDEEWVEWMKQLEWNLGKKTTISGTMEETTNKF